VWNFANDTTSGKTSSRPPVDQSCKRMEITSLFTYNEMAALAGLQVLTASNQIDAVHNEPLLWNINMEATEDDRELAWARISDIFGLSNGLSPASS